MDALFTIKDVADLFSVSQKTVRRLLYDLNAFIPFKRIGSINYVSNAQLIEIIPILSGNHCVDSNCFICNL